MGLGLGLGLGLEFRLGLCSATEAKGLFGDPLPVERPESGREGASELPAELTVLRSLSDGLTRRRPLPLEPKDRSLP